MSFAVERSTEEIVLRPSPAARLIAWVSAALAVVFWVTALGDDAMPASDRVRSVIYLAAWSVAAVAAVCAAARSKVVLDPEGVTIRCFRVRTIPWSDVAGIGVRRTTGWRVAWHWSVEVWPVLITGTGERIGLPIVAGYSRRGYEPASFSHLRRLLVSRCEQFGGHVPAVHKVAWRTGF